MSKEKISKKTVELRQKTKTPKFTKKKDWKDFRAKVNKDKK